MQQSLFGPFRSDTDYEVVPAAVHDVVPLLVLIVFIIALGTFPYDLAFDMIIDATQPVVGGETVAAFGGDP
jgi:NADH-quinone oxidoreductase subunit M